MAVEAVHSWSPWVRFSGVPPCFVNAYVPENGICGEQANKNRDRSVVYLDQQVPALPVHHHTVECPAK